LRKREEEAEGRGLNRKEGMHEGGLREREEEVEGGWVSGRRVHKERSADNRQRDKTSFR
jgi:hypothetical protein